MQDRGPEITFQVRFVSPVAAASVKLGRFSERCSERSIRAHRVEPPEDLLGEQTVAVDPVFQHLPEAFQSVTADKSYGSQCCGTLRNRFRIRKGEHARGSVSFMGLT